MYLNKKPTKTPSTDEPIHPSERFSRAKRNALFWVATTILLAVGSSSPESPMEVSGIVRNFGFPQNALLMGSVVVLLFMLAGYRRAERHLLAQHTSFALERRMEEVTEVADSLIGKLNEWHDEAQLIKAEASATADVIKERHWRAEKQIKDARATVPNYHQWLNDIGLKKDDGKVVLAGPIDPKKLVLGASILENTLEGFRKSLDAAYANVRGTLVINVDEELKRRQDAITSIEEKAASLSTNLSEFATAIGAGERRWFWLHDRLPVWGGAVLATILAYFRISSPQQLNSWLSAFFF